MKFQVEVQSSKVIKPCTPTPSHLRSYNISIIDELNPSMHVPRIMYYPHNAVIDGIDFGESLARVLPIFYPLAGRYVKERHLVDCNDEGAEYSEALVDCDLLSVVGSDVSTDTLYHLLPFEIGAADEPTDPLLAVRVNRFRCGGLAISVYVSHRISDSCSVGIFLSAWADAVAGREVTVKPDFDSASHFPAENLDPLAFGVSRKHDESIVCRRFLFDGDAISSLRARVNPEWGAATGGRPPSRVVAVSTVLAQAILRTDRAVHGESRACLMAQAINVRERTVPPVPKDAWGTWVSSHFLEFTARETRGLETDFQGLMLKMRESTVQGIKDCARILSDKEFGRWVLVGSDLDAAKKAETPDYKVIWITDWSKFGEYELDFGFGKPVWVSLAAAPIKDLLVLMNTKDNQGIEAWVCLHESEMPHFEQDRDIRMLTTRGTCRL